MSDHESIKQKRRIWPWITLAVIVILLGGLRLAMRSDMVLDRIRAEIESRAGEELRAELKIGRLEGDLWSHLTVKEIRLIDSGDEVVRVDSVHIAYAMTDLVFRRPLTLRKLYVDGVRADLVQDGDGEWNLIQMLPPTVEEEPPEDEDPFLFTVEDIRVSAPEVTVDAGQLLPGEPLAVRELELQARAGRAESGFFADVSQLDLTVHESRFDEPVSVASEASWDGRHISLDRLVVAGARSLFEMSGSYDSVTSSVDVESLLDPLAWDEVAAYMEPYPIRQDLSVSLQVGGSKQELVAGLTVSADGLDNFRMEARANLLNEPLLTHFSASLDRMDLAELTGSDTLDAWFNGFEVAMDGSVPLGDWDRVRLDGTLAMEEIRFGEYGLDAIGLNLDVSDQIARSEVFFRKGDERVDLELEAERWWDPGLSWQLHYRTEGLNPGFWSGLPELEGNLVSSGTLTGTGREPGGPYPWDIAMDVEQFSISGYPGFSANITGSAVSDSLAFTLDGASEGARILLDGGLSWKTAEPEYAFNLEVENFNTAIFPELEALVTDINGRVEVSGSGMDPESLDLEARMTFDDSEVNGQHFDTIEMNMALQEGIVRVEQARVSGPPATANLTLVQNIFNFRDPQNRLDFDLELHDLQGFANLAGADTLQAQGRLTGNIRPDNEGVLVFESGMNLNHIQYDTLHVEQIEGFAMTRLTEDPIYHVNLDIREPKAGAFTIRDISLITDGRLIGHSLQGDYDFEFNIENESGLRTQADYTIADTLQVRTHLLDLTDPAGVYTLQSPFDLTLADELVMLDTLRLRSGRSSEVSMYLNKTPETPWTGFLNAQNTDLGQVQYIFMEQPVFGAVFTGQMNFLADDDRLEVEAHADIAHFEYDQFALDSARFAFDVKDKRLVSDAHVWHDDKELLRSELSLPFEPENLGAHAPEFYEEAISGYLHMDRFDVTMFQDLLDDWGLQGVAGTFSLQTDISGIARQPELIGELRLEDGSISGVAVDTLLVSWDYDHSRNNLLLASRIYSLEQLAADISGVFPLHIDVPNLVFEGPRSDDPVDINVCTNEFNLAALNDFLDPAQLRNLQGRLDADFDIKGTVDDPVMEGSIAFSGGRVHLVPNNITLRNMAFDVDLIPGEVELNRMSAQSSGSFNGSGVISLDGLMPEEFDLQFDANNFRVSNTRDMDIFAGLDMALTGSIEQPHVAGSVIWERGTVFIDDFGESQVEEVVLEEETDTQPEGPDIFERLSMEVIFSVDRNAFVRNRGEPEVNLAMRGEIDLLKEPFGELQLFGNMELPSGHVTVLNKRFRLQHGNIIFSGDPEDPELDIRTLYEPRQQYEDIRIYYHITGTISDPAFEYDSEPEMELQDIISYTLFGRPFHALAGWEQTVSGRSDGSLATNIAVDILLDRIENLAADRLGIDVIEIENTRKGGGSGTSIKAGKYVSDRLFVAFLQELGGTEAGQQISIEYMIRRNLEMIITASDDYRSGVDMLWRYDY